MFFKFFARRRRYLDYASSTPVDAAMHRAIPRLDHSVVGANPSALHKEGVQARAVIDSARKRVADVLHAHADEIIFTSGATESDNLALAGVIESHLAQGIGLTEIAIVTSTIEHAAVLETIAPYIARGMFAVTLPTTNGVVSAGHISIPEGIKVLIVSIMYVNNEIGTVQPIKEIAKRIRKLRKDNPEVTIVFHTDATQAPLHHNLRVDQLGVDLMTLGATKLYTHKGVGVLYKKRSVTLVPIMRGGGQERGLRPGTEPTELIHTFAHALVHAQGILEAETTRIKDLQTYFETRLKESIPEAYITAESEVRTPHITHVALKGMDSELMVIELDARGIAVSAKSACKNDLSRLASSKAGEDQESPIVEQIYGTGYGGVRFSFGRMTTKKDLDIAVKALKKVLDKYEK